MALKHGYSKKTLSKNIGTLVKDFKKSGKIGSSKPKSKSAAIKQAVAISYSIRKQALAKKRGKK